jgi:hypothetical protein
VDRKRARPRYDDEPVSTYVYRRPLAARELLPAVGVGVGVGLAAFYIARVLLQRTPLVPRGGAAPGETPGERVRRGPRRPVD